MLLLAMTGDSETCKKVRDDIAKILIAWRQGKLLARWEVPTFAHIYTVAHCGPRPDDDGAAR